MTLGVILLFAAIILIFLGLAQRVLDRMQLTDKQAVMVLVLILVGSFITIPLYKGNVDVRINVGGGVIPLILAFYVLGRAGTAKEVWRAVISTLVTTAVLYTIFKYFYGNVGHQSTFLDPIYVYGLVGGATAYLAGRSRRSAFISATLGVMLLDAVTLIEHSVRGTSGQVNFGGAGAFDTTIIAGVVAVLLAELVGESREALQGGPVKEDRPIGLSTRGMTGADKRKGDQIADLDGHVEEGNDDEK